MNANDADITRGRRRRKTLALVVSVSVLLSLLLYFGWLFMTKGYRVVVNPEDAALSASFSVKSGTAFFVDDKFYVIGSSAAFEVNAAKYYPQTVETNSATASVIDVTLKPLPASVTVKTEPVLQDVTWTVNGDSAGTSSSLVTELEAGEYTVIASHPYYQSGLIRFDAEIAEQIQQTVPLEPVQGAMVLNSQPQGATVRINDDVRGVTPLQIDTLGGRYSVSLTLTGYQPVDDEVEVTQLRSTAQRDYRLKPVQAELTVNAKPAGGVLLVDGKPAVSPVSLDANTRYTIRYEKPGFFAQQTNVLLKPSQSKTIAFDLEKELGDVIFSSNEPAEIWLNGVKQGQTPFRLSIQALTQQVEFKKAGYRSVVKTFTPSSQLTTRVDARMLKEFDARREEGRPLFISTLGIDMIKVSPRAFTMGSAANEKDRQRNEHPVSVDFERDVWIAKHEITEAQFAAFSQQATQSTLPVTDVTWEQAALFTNWLSEQEGLTPYYRFSGSRYLGVSAASRGYRLPTEAEWEFIAKVNRRASATTFVWGNTARLRDKQGNFADASRKGKQTFILSDYDDGFAEKSPVGSFGAERGGFFDLDGNVREWVHDFYSVTPPDLTKTHIDYSGVTRGSAHVVKGASFKTGRFKNLRASVREGESGKADDIGFRIARYERSIQ